MNPWLLFRKDVSLAISFKDRRDAMDVGRKLELTNQASNCFANITRQAAYFMSLSCSFRSYIRTSDNLLVGITKKDELAQNWVNWLTVIYDLQAMNFEIEADIACRKVT